MQAFHLRPAICILAAACILPGSAKAQDFVRAWPAKLVTVIIPFPPGGSTEAEGRLYAQKMSDNLGKSFILDYKPGASTTIGANYVAKASPDGYTLLGTTTSYSLAAAFYPDLPYDYLKDITQLSLMSRRPAVLVVSTKFPGKTPREYIDYARANPGKINFATTGAGGSPHIGGASLHGMTNTKVTFLHYKGSGPLMTDLLAGRIDSTITTFITAAPLHRAGKLHIIGTTAGERSPQFPEFPSMAEVVPGYSHTSWWGFMAPGKMLPALQARISAEMIKAGRDPEVSRRMTADGAIMTTSTPDEFRKAIAADVARLKKLASEHNINAEN
jgi:tripartite-type tricarboxylate transporter receptor subunit TctC